MSDYQTFLAYFLPINCKEKPLDVGSSKFRSIKCVCIVIHIILLIIGILDPFFTNYFSKPFILFLIQFPNSTFYVWMVILIAMICCIGTVTWPSDQFNNNFNNNDDDDDKDNYLLSVVVCLVSILLIAPLITGIIIMAPLLFSCMIFISLEFYTEYKVRKTKDCPNYYYMKVSNFNLRWALRHIYDVQREYIVNGRNIDNECIYFNLKYYVILWRCLCHTNNPKSVENESINYEVTETLNPLDVKWMDIRLKYEPCLKALLSRNNVRKMGLIKELYEEYFMHNQHITNQEYRKVKCRIITTMIVYIILHAAILNAMWWLFGRNLNDQYKDNIYMIWIIRDVVYSILVFVLCVLRFYHFKYEVLENYSWLEPDIENNGNIIWQKASSNQILNIFCYILEINAIYGAIDVSIDDKWIKDIICEYMFGYSQSQCIKWVDANCSDTKYDTDQVDVSNVLKTNVMNTLLTYSKSDNI